MSSLGISPQEGFVPSDMFNRQSVELLNAASDIPKNRSNLGLALHAAKRALETGVLVTEVLPINEALRYSAFAAAQLAGSEPLISGVVLGGATFAIEGAAALATASILEGDRSKKAIDLIHKGLNKVGVSKDIKFSPLTKAGIALTGGSAVVTVVKHNENLDRTKSQNRKYGLGSAAGISGFCAVQGYLMAQGIETPNPLTVGGGILAVSSIIAGLKWVKSRVKHEESEESM